MIILEFAKNFKSIHRFNKVDLTDFSVVVGLNGSGKTHLLRAIDGGHVTVDGLSESNIVYFNFENFLVKSQQTANISSAGKSESLAWGVIEALRPVLLEIDNELKKLILPTEAFPYCASVCDENLNEYNKLIGKVDEVIAGVN